MDKESKTIVLAIVVGFVIGSVLFAGIGYSVFLDVIHIEDPLTFEEELSLAFFYYSDLVDVDGKDTEVFKYHYEGQYYLIFVENISVLTRGRCLRWRYATLD